MPTLEKWEIKSCVCGEKEIHLEELFQALNENYEAIFYVDFEQDKVYPYCIKKELTEVLGEFLEQKPSYKELMNTYIDVVVSKKDKDEMRAVTKFSFLKEQLKYAKAYTYEYHLERNGIEYVFRFKIANIEDNGELKRAVVGMADVSTQKAVELRINHIGNKILIVEDDEISCMMLKEILSSTYEVLVAGNGKEALLVLEEHYTEIAVIITDLVMPEMDGYDLLNQVKKMRQYSNIPVIVSTGAGINSEADRDSVEATCLELGASDFVVKPYNARSLKNRIKSLIRLRESTNILASLEKDSLTGLYTKDFFYHVVEEFLKMHPDENYAMWVTGIDGLKVINEKYGIEKGDDILRMLAAFRFEQEGFIYAGRIEGDKFAALVKESFIPFIFEITKTPNMGIDFSLASVVVKHGLYRIRPNSSLRPQGMYDRALLAMQKIKNKYGVYLLEYDDELRKELLTTKLLEEESQTALLEHQFVLYYQPKFDIQKGQTEGAEALVRWIHPELGFMNPGQFISQFEQNGFIRELDFYVWEEACKTLLEWKDKGVRLIPISVNVSRRDFEDEFLAEKILALVDSYGIDHNYFHIEVTESAYADNPQRVIDIIRKFHDNGFMVELDDFGSGYSSMTAISELNVDVMKLDMSLIRKDNPESDRSALEFSVQLAKMMNVKTVAEGVETKQQVDRIASLGGDYIQGYYYSKPLPKKDFEEYMLREERKDG